MLLGLVLFFFLGGLLDIDHLDRRRAKHYPSVPGMRNLGQLVTCLLEHLGFRIPLAVPEHLLVDRRPDAKETPSPGAADLRRQLGLGTFQQLIGCDRALADLIPEVVFLEDFDDRSNIVGHLGRKLKSGIVLDRSKAGRSGAQ